MRVHGYVVPLEDDDGRVEGVLGAEVEGQQERLTLVQRVRGAAHVDRPTERAEQTFLQVVGLWGVPSELRLGFVDLNFECSNVCPNLLGLMGIWQKRLGKNTEIKVNPTQVSAHLGHPVFEFHCCNLPQLLNTQKSVPFHLNAHFNLQF